MKRLKFINKLIIAIIFLFTFSSCDSLNNIENKDDLKVESLAEDSNKIDNKKKIDENSFYYTMEDVSNYIHKFNKLPNNYLTKKEAKKLGWIPKENNLWQVTDKGVIGGDYYGNYENKLADGNYKECDVNYDGGKRNAERLVFDEKGNIYYTKDHYETFERIY